MLEKPENHLKIRTNQEIVFVCRTGIVGTQIAQNEILITNISLRFWRVTVKSEDNRKFGKTWKFILFVKRCCGYSNCAKLSPKHEFLTNILIWQFYQLNYGFIKLYGYRKPLREIPCPARSSLTRSLLPYSRKVTFLLYKAHSWVTVR